MADLIYELTFVAVIIIFISYFNVDGNICVKPDPFFDKLQTQRKLNAEPFSVYNSNGLMDCYRQCGLYSLCRAVNYDSLTLSCELISSENSSVRVVNHGVVLDRASMNPEILGSCRHHECPNNTRCEVWGSGFTCVPAGCIGLPSTDFVNASSFLIKSFWSFNETILYACELGYYPSINATCTSTGSFSAFVCKPFTMCTHVAKCQRSVVGEYWFHMRNLGDKVKLYCSSGSAPPFITLTGFNTASTPGYMTDPINGGCVVSSIDPEIYPQVGFTDYQKTRFRSSSGTLNIGGNSFSNSTQNFQRFGTSGDCYSGNVTSNCPAIGYFIINTTRTGLRVKSSMQWRTWGVDGWIESITRSDDGLVVEGRCGGGRVSGGSCGGCEPDGHPTLELDPTFTPEFKSATVPHCKTLL